MQKEELHLIIKEGEGLRAEFKEHYSSKIDKDIVAFANSKGGYLILGVDDNGKITGEILTNKLKAEIIDLARKCEPSIAIKKISHLDKTIIIEIGESFEKPHSCSHGYFRRLDAVTQKMSQHEIKLLFKESLYKTSFEENIHQHATWDSISKDKINNFLKEAKLNISDFDVPNIFSSLGLAINSSIKNAGILFFAKQPRKLISQCQMTLAAFKGINRTVIYDRIDIQDDLFTQFNEAMKFLKKHINVRSEIKEINRKDIYEIPLAALREAVANAIIHRLCQAMHKE